MLATALAEEPARNLILAPFFADHLRRTIPSLRKLVAEGALNGLGWPGVTDARVGKLIEFDLAGAEDPQGEAKKMCEQLLANTVIESYRVEIL